MTTCNLHTKCIKSALTEAEKICLQKDLNFTKLRKNILILIWESHNPLKAYDILQHLQKIDPSAKPITVYRALNFLLKNHIIHKLESQNTFFGCSHPGKAHNCYFLICKACNKVEEGCKTDLLKDIYKNFQQKNFKIEHITLEIQGKCKVCLNKIA